MVCPLVWLRDNLSFGVDFKSLAVFVKDDSNAFVEVANRVIALGVGWFAFGVDVEPLAVFIGSSKSVVEVTDPVVALAVGWF